MKNKSFIITLCHRCKAEFMNTDENYIRRSNPNQTYKEKCTYCNHRNGYDYEIIPKSRKENR